MPKIPVNKSFTATTNSKLEQEICLFKTSLAEDEVKATVKQPKNVDQLFQRHQEKYAKSIYIPDWRDVLLVLPGTKPEIDPTNLKLSTTSSYHIQAIREGVTKDVTPVTVGGLILTDDNKLVYGIRGGKTERRKACIVPAGYVSNRCKGNNPIFSNFYDELAEELGVKRDKVTYPRLLGYQTDPEFTKAINFVLNGKTKYGSSRLEKMHKEAFTVYQKALETGKSEMDAVKAIKEAGLPNIDAWEHTDLVFINNNPFSIQKIVDSRKVEHEGKEYHMLDIGRGSLILYLKSRGREFWVQANFWNDLDTKLFNYR